MGPRNRPHGTPSNFSEWCSLCAIATRFRYGTCRTHDQHIVGAGRYHSHGAKQRTVNLLRGDHNGIQQ
jgi:hypothetical protein